MIVTAKSLGIDRLDRQERLALVQEIWDGLVADSPTPTIGLERARELDRRLAEDDAAPDDLIPWEEVKAKTLAGLKKP